MTNQELEYLIRRIAREQIPLSRLDGAGADPGDVITWDGDEWVPEAPPQPGFVSNVSGADLNLNFVSDTTDAVAILDHGLGSTSISLQLMMSVADGLWTAFWAPWRVLDSNRIEVRAQLGFSDPARAVITAII